MSSEEISDNIVLDHETSISSIIKRQMADLIHLKNPRLLLRLWGELDSPEKPELEIMVQQYHSYLIKNGWNAFYGILCLWFSLMTILVWGFVSDDDPLLGYFRILFPSLVIIFSAFDIIIKKNPIIYKYIFVGWTIFLGITMTHENMEAEQFRIYEIWPIFYFS